MLITDGAHLAEWRVDAVDSDDIRVRSGIGTPRSVSAILGMNVETLRSWSRVRGHRIPMVHTVPNERRGWPTIPLIGLAEAHVIHVLRTGVGLKLSTIADFVERVREEGDEYGLASPDLVTDKIDIYRPVDSDLERVYDGHRPLSAVVQPFLRPIRLWQDGIAGAFAPDGLPGVEIDPRFSAGRMSFRRSRVPVFAVVGALAAGEAREVVAEDYGLSMDEVELVESKQEWLASVA